MKFRKIDIGEWTFYADAHRISEVQTLDCGKWMCFFTNTKKDFAFIDKLCKRAVKTKVAIETKHTRKFVTWNNGSGVCCFYCDGTDIEAHKKIISFLLKNDMIRRKENNSFYNMAFKYEYQSDNNEYTPNFTPQISLKDFIDLNTGEWHQDN